ncbi:hypothetical protein DYB32_006559 [Aphanomyces invadans]|uniref:Uncharacterized protein n=1 Tax=Aphanomyces invadans TaxID=157072 RepID=A0A418ARG1_9STRA|nr:hypothetical protein DYB32_006559 [Aphanomyces invadans]
MHKWLGITHSDSEDGSSSSDEDYFDSSFDESKRLKAQAYADNIAARSWGLSHRDKAGLTQSSLALTADVAVHFHEELGQQRRVWDCALVLSKFLANSAYFPPHAAGLDDTRRLYVDVTSAIPRPFDVILCSDLIYGDTDLADLLLATIRALSHASTLVVFAHEARYAGNQGRYFLDMIAATHTVDVISYDVLDPIYRATNIHVHLLHPRLADVSDAADPGAATVAKPAGVCVQERHG